MIFFLEGVFFIFLQTHVTHVMSREAWQSLCCKSVLTDLSEVQMKSMPADADADADAQRHHRGAPKAPGW